jgi:hypothetical protein
VDLPQQEDRLAGVSRAVMVAIQLVRIGGSGTVVTRVAQTVPVRIPLITIGQPAAIVLIVAGAVVISVIKRIARARVTDIATTIAIAVDPMGFAAAGQLSVGHVLKRAGSPYPSPSEWCSYRRVANAVSVQSGCRPRFNST